MEAGEALPMMETDVTLFNPNTQEKLILDAKFYREALVSKFGGREKVRRGSSLADSFLRDEPGRPEQAAYYECLRSFGLPYHG